jgi:tRNA 5-methylaminomethyl-2-thiouridine biosynthesis bifunctional protein
VRPVRGQLSWAPDVTAPFAAAWGAYAAPAPGGLLFGATYDRGDADCRWRAADDARNHAALSGRLPGLAASLAGGPIAGRASVRAATPDHLPLAGPIGPGLCVLGGLGSRGFVLAPLLAEHVAAVALGAPSPLPSSLAKIVAPVRFSERARRRSSLASSGTIV